MSEIGKKATKIWKKQCAIIKKSKDARDVQIKKYANLILDVFGASSDKCLVSTVMVTYDSKKQCLNCIVKIDSECCGETETNYQTTVEDENINDAMLFVNECEATPKMITFIYDFLSTNEQCNKYFEITLGKDCELVVKRRKEEDVTICDEEELEE